MQHAALIKEAVAFEKVSIIGIRIIRDGHLVTLAQRVNRDQRDGALGHNVLGVGASGPMVAEVDQWNERMACSGGAWGMGTTEHHKLRP